MKSWEKERKGGMRERETEREKERGEEQEPRTKETRRCGREKETETTMYDRGVQRNSKGGRD